MMDFSVRKFVPIKQPETGHPLVVRLFKEMERQQIGILDMAERAGINKNSPKDWRTRYLPRIDSLEACYNVLGMTLVPVKRRDE